MTIEDYKNKRNFKKTSEPGLSIGKSKNKEDKKLSFVIHKHFASRLHFDLRLEHEGVLKSWAIPKGPTANPKLKRLAVMVEDHPLDYKDFEDVIPEGNYGAGRVYVWDSGTYHSREFEDYDNSEDAIREGIDKGHLTFILEGDILKGEFALVKLKKGGPNDWLFIKKNDEFATEKDVAKIKAPNEDKAS